MQILKVKVNGQPMEVVRLKDIEPELQELERLRTYEVAADERISQLTVQLSTTEFEAHIRALQLSAGALRCAADVIEAQATNNETEEL